MGAEATAVTNYADLLPIATEAVERASQLLLHEKPGALTTKGDRDFASNLDYLIERDLRSFLQERTPDIGFLGEEEGEFGSGEMQWALDPIDGTVNFVRGIPMCGISLGLIHNGQPTLGIIDLPFLRSRYTAAAGSGAYVNGKRIKARASENIGEAVVAIGDYAV